MIFVTSFVYETYANSLRIMKQIEPEKNVNNNQNKTITELVKEQTEAIKKIVSLQRPTQIDYPTVTRKDPDIKSEVKLKEEKEKESIEQLRIKCQHLFKVMSKNDDNSPTTRQPLTTTFATAIPFGPALKPDFLKNKPKFTTNINDEIETTSASTQQIIENLSADSTQLNPIVSVPVNDKQDFLYPYTANDNSIKYIKLEPVILQRMLMSNGQNYFYWYRTVPNYVKYAEPHQQLFQTQEQSKYSIKYVVPSSTPAMTTTKPITTTTTTPRTTTVSTTTPTITSAYAAINNVNANGYKHEFKFVVPYNFNNDKNLYANGQIDPYAYYPKYFQPNTMNVQIPYVPTFQMIKTLSVPNDGNDSSYQLSEEKI